MKKKVLSICTYNSARSQTAEGLLRSLYGDRYEVYSAGTQPTEVNPYAVKVMAEIDIDISGQDAKSVQKYLGEVFDYVVTVCDSAKEACPFFPGGKEFIHKGFEDPSQFTGGERETIEVFRWVRDDIKTWIQINFLKANEVLAKLNMI